MKNLLFVFLLPILFTDTLSAMELIKNGKLTVSGIVIPEKAYPTVEYAAQEISCHLEMAASEKLPIIKETDVQQDKSYIYLGSCRANQKFKSDEMALDSGIIEIGKSDIKIVGKDGSGKLYDSNNSIGTLYATYEFLEKKIGIRWIWPGKTGEIIPKHKNLSLKEGIVKVQAKLKSSMWRITDGKFHWSSAENRKKFFDDQAKWLLRHRFNHRSIYSNGHAFGKYFNEYGKTHPEFFSLLPDGTRRPNPYMWSYGYPRDVSMCVTSESLIKHIVREFMKGSRDRMINVNENDTGGECVCANCLKADNSPIPDEERLKKAKELFAQKKMGWESEALGTLSDRYCQFYLAVQKEAEKQGVKNPQIAGLIYSNYSAPPTDKIKLNDRIHLRFCPPIMYPWNPAKVKSYKDIWAGWAKTGATLQFRPNFTLDGNCFPIQYHEEFYDVYTFSAKRSMVAVDMDSYAGHPGAQGLVNYVIATLNHDRDIPLELLKDEFYSAFGAGKEKVKEYFEYLTRITMKTPFKNPFAQNRNNEGGELQWNLLLIADNIFTPEVMAKSARLLDEAASAPDLDAASAERIKHLRIALEHIRLIMAAQMECRKYQEALSKNRENASEKSFDEAVIKLDAYRASIEHLGAINVGHARFLEDRHWKKFPLSRYKNMR
ncbi:MAG: DUF4838 domain-containing protein [Lentisphaerae bacterium]|nr:DUF4838 domain-containing protein [Lentisphaerota bacterium]